MNKPEIASNNNSSIHKNFAAGVVNAISQDPAVIGLAVAGSWITNEIDEFSDLDLILVTKEKISHNKDLMLSYAHRFGNLLNGFTGEHVGEPRVLICLYDKPLLHVDIKFVTLEEFKVRIETPAILFDRDDQLKNAINNSVANFPYPDYQWIEDRFWIWIHYAIQKIGRGEYLEAYDFLAFLRLTVFGPLLQIKNEKPPRGVRKVEMDLPAEDLEALLSTLSGYSKQALINSVHHAIALYQNLRSSLAPADLVFQAATEERVLAYLQKLGIKTL